MPVKTTTVAPSLRRRTTASSNCAATTSGSRAGPDDVVAAGRERDEVGLERERGLDLAGDDLRDELAAHGEVRVGEVVDLLRQHLGDAVGPAAVAVGQIRLGIADPLGERVADGDVAPPGVRLRIRRCRGCGDRRSWSLRLPRFVTVPGYRARRRPSVAPTVSPGSSRVVSSLCVRRRGGRGGAPMEDDALADLGRSRR